MFLKTIKSKSNSLCAGSLVNCRYLFFHHIQEYRINLVSTVINKYTLHGDDLVSTIIIAVSKQSPPSGIAVY